jgi:hypothetical protein
MAPCSYGDTFEQSYDYFLKGLAHSHTALVFRRNQSVLPGLGRREERMAKRVASFNYF